MRLRFKFRDSGDAGDVSPRGTGLSGNDHLLGDKLIALSIGPWGFRWCIALPPLEQRGIPLAIGFAPQRLAWLPTHRGSPEMLCKEPVHLEHAHLVLASEYRLKLLVRQRLALVLRVLEPAPTSGPGTGAKPDIGRIPAWAVTA